MNSTPRILIFDTVHGLSSPWMLRVLAKQYVVTVISDDAYIEAELVDLRSPDVLLLHGDASQCRRVVSRATQYLAPSSIVYIQEPGGESITTPGDPDLGIATCTSDPEQVCGVIEQRITRPSPEISLQDGEITDLHDNSCFVRSGARMKELEAQARLIARANIPVLILGESGTGKEVLAKYIHLMSPRRDKMFLKVNCAAMPTDLLESELFGHEQGAFTGAVKAKPGKFEICAGGTIFLDEIGEMPAALQAKLLHVLQDGTFSRLGARTQMTADVRVLAATNINVKAAIADRSFREDLYYRLNGFSFTIPPLRERAEEIGVFADYFMHKSAARYGKEPRRLSPAFKEALTHYRWPGNLRELDNIITRYLLIGSEEDVLAEIAGTTHAASSNKLIHHDGLGGLKDLVKNVKGNAEAGAIARALEETRWNRRAAARKMQISYKALLYKIKQYEIAPH